MLTHWLFLVAIQDPAEEISKMVTPAKTSGMGLQEILLVAGMVSIVGLLLFLWVYLTHKGRRHRHADPGKKAIYEADSESDHRRRKHRKRRPNHPDNLPRNPTLAEAGGLPPVRPEEPSEPVR